MMTAATCRLLLLLLLLGVHLAAAYTLAVGSASPRRQRTRPLSMNRVDSEGFNSFRRWPSAAPVTLTESAKAFLGLDDGSAARELTFDEIREATTACDDEAIDEILDARPMADQRGETVVLDAEQGQLRWVKEVA